MALVPGRKQQIGGVHRQPVSLFAVIAPYAETAVVALHAGDATDGLGDGRVAITRQNRVGMLQPVALPILGTAQDQGPQPAAGLLQAAVGVLHQVLEMVVQIQGRHRGDHQTCGQGVRQHGGGQADRQGKRLCRAESPIGAPGVRPDTAGRSPSLQRRSMAICGSNPSVSRRISRSSPCPCAAAAVTGKRRRVRP
jgi:hypothetical protein